MEYFSRWLCSWPTSARAAEQENAVCLVLSPHAVGFSVRKALALECVNGIVCVLTECSRTAWSDYRGASCPVWFSNLPPTCHLAPLHNRSTWSNWSACQRIPRLTGSSRAVHSPLHVFPFYFSSLSSNGRNTSNYLLRRGCQRDVAGVYYMLLRILRPACFLCEDAPSSALDCITS